METISLSDKTPLGTDDLKRLRVHAARVLERLEQKIHNDCTDGNPFPPSWVNGESECVSHGTNGNDNNTDKLTEATDSFRKRYFDDYGFWVARGFCNADEASCLKQAMGDSVQQHWFPQGTSRDSDNDDQPRQEEKITSFGTDAKSNEARGDPFLESADKVSYFAEPTALDAESGNLQREFCDQKLLALCKAGHGLHVPPSFRKAMSGDNRDNNKEEKEEEYAQADVHQPFFEYTTSQKMLELVQSLGWNDPVVPQSMYIFKNPRVGGAVHSHQDSTFLYTTPRQTCLGLWLALDDATLHNGCLWVRPKSHREPLRRQFLRNPRHQADQDEPKLTFVTHHENSEVTWEGATPNSVEVGDEGADESEVSSLNFIPVEVKAGDLVVFCGTLDHFSLPNFSEEQRHTFQLHLVEGPNAGITWSPSNWLQYERGGGQWQGGKEFLRLLDYATHKGEES